MVAVLDNKISSYVSQSSRAPAQIPFDSSSKLFRANVVFVTISAVSRDEGAIIETEETGSSPRKRNVSSRVQKRRQDVRELWAHI